MNRLTMLVLLLSLVGCGTKKDEPKGSPATTGSAPTPASGSGSATSGSAATGSAAAGSGAGAGGSGAAGSGAAGSGAGSAPAAGTGFAPFDDALAGTKAWLAADDKSGLVELIAIDDASGKTKAQLSVVRRCEGDAVKAVEALAAKIALRVKAGTHEAPRCIDHESDMARKACVLEGNGEGDLGYELDYAKTGDAWRLIGIQTYAMGITMDQQAVQFEKLLKSTCP